MDHNLGLEIYTQLVSRVQGPERFSSQGSAALEPVEMRYTKPGGTSVTTSTGSFSELSVQRPLCIVLVTVTPFGDVSAPFPGRGGSEHRQLG